MQGMQIMADQKIVPFLFEGEAMVRVVERDGSPWFVAADVCRVLGIEKHRDALTKLDEDERGSVEVDTLGGRQTLAAVNESGLYTLILRSRDATKPGTVAHRFRKWVTGEVLPALRRTGRYEAPAAMRREPPAAIEPKPFWEWTLEEVRTHLSVANCYRHTLNTASAAWYLMAAGFPKPPARLMPAWWQADLDLPTRRDSAALTITVPLNGATGAH
jgi:prophage antirepressor-like protein